MIKLENEDRMLYEMNRLQRLIFEDKDNYAVFVSITDESLEKIKQNNKIFSDEGFMKRILLEEGDNIHILFLKCPGRKSMVRNYIRSLLKQFKTISWVSNNLTKFSILRSRQCTMCH